MFDQHLYVQAKLDDLNRGVIRHQQQRAADPRAEAPRTGVGIRHEVFRRIAGDDEPRQRHSFWRRLTSAE